MHSPIFYGTDDVKQYLDKPFSTSDHPHDIHNLSQLTKSLFESSVPESDYVTPIVANTDRNSWGVAPDNFDETYMSVVATEGGHLELLSQHQTEISLEEPMPINHLQTTHQPETVSSPLPALTSLPRHLSKSYRHTPRNLLVPNNHESR